MARANDYVDPEYDRKLAEYKALKAKMRQQQNPSSQSSQSGYQQK